MSTVNELRQTALHAWHAAHDARMVDFAGWSMPIQYTSIIEEHHATRKAIGMFDVSHMGRFFFKGKTVDKFLDRLATRRVDGMSVGRIRYALMTNEQGGILDDVLIYHLPDADGKPYFMMVVNASNRDKIRNWIEAHRTPSDSFELEDRTLDTVMIACQGPSANAMVSEICDIEPDQLKYYTGTSTRVCGAEAIVSRTGYTGEDGCEIITDNRHAMEIWEEIYERAIAVRGKANGLAARDTLRLEAAMPLYGHELNEQTNAAQTGLDFAINCKERQFIGRDAIQAARQDSNLPRRVGIVLDGRRVARQHCPLIDGDRVVGEVTSGTFSPTLEQSISMGYVQPDTAESSTSLQVDIRGKSCTARIVPLPFYSRS